MLDGYLFLKSLESYRSELSIIIAKKIPIQIVSGSSLNLTKPTKYDMNYKDGKKILRLFKFHLSSFYCIICNNVFLFHLTLNLNSQSNFTTPKSITTTKLKI